MSRARARRRQALAAMAGAVALVACAAPWSGTHRSEAVDPPPSILIVLIDALRPDHLGAYGYARPTSPALDALAAESVLFERAYSVSSWTKPTIPSLFTGLYPSQHGVLEGNARARAGRLESDLLSDDAWTMAEALREAGYRTAAFVHNAHLRAEFGLDQGFERYEEMSADANGMTAALLDWVVALPADQPFFAYLHLLDVHWPYEPPPAMASRFGVRKEAVEIDRSLLDAVNDGYVECDSGRLDLLVGLYDAEIRFVDEALGLLFERLGRLRAPDELALIVTADHGEAFLEHGHLGHGKSLHEETVRVPLLARLPGAGTPGTRHAGPVSLIDLMPTVLDLAGSVDARRSTLPGRSLLSESRPGEGGREATLAEVRHGRTTRAAVWDAGWKLIRTTRAARETAEALPGVDRAYRPLVGRRVEIRGTRQPAGRFLASSVELERGYDDDDEIAGTLESFDADAERARIAGFEVDLSDARFLDAERHPVAASVFSVGSRVKAEGEAVGPTLFTADKLRLLEHQSETEIEGVVRRVNDSGDGPLPEVAGLDVVIGARQLEALLDAAAARDGSAAADDAVALELYDLQADPRERINLAADPRHAKRLDRLVSLLDDLQRRHAQAALPEETRVVLDEDTVARLRALGYVR